MVKAVPSGASFDETIGSSRRRRASAAVSGAQTMPQVLRMMKAIFSGVQREAATMRSPSFSRSSSSVTMTISPRAKASMVSATLLDMAASRGPDRPRKSLGVTAPPVAAVMRSALSREIQAAGSLQSAVTLAGDRPTCFAKALRAILFCRSQTSSFMP